MNIPNEPDNYPRWDGAEPGRYEVWYITGAARSGTLGFWVRFTTAFPLRGEPGAYLWLGIFERPLEGPPRARGWKKHYPLGEFSWVGDPFELQVGDSVLSMDRTEGAMVVGGTRLFWSLNWKPAAWTYAHIPARLAASRFNRTVVHSPNPVIAPAGVIRIDDEVFDIHDAGACQSHIWGRRHAAAWQWAHASAFHTTDGAPAPGVSMELLSARVKVLGLPSPAMSTFEIRDGEQRVTLNGLRDALRNRARLRGRSLEFSGEHETARVEGCVTWTPESMLVATYHDPDSREVYCHNTEVADTRLVVSRRADPRAKWDDGRVYLSRGTTCFEFGARRPCPGYDNAFVVE